MKAEKDVKVEVDDSRRSLGAALLGTLGFAALSGCTNQVGGQEKERVGQIGQALEGMDVGHISSIGSTPTVVPRAANLRSRSINNGGHHIMIVEGYDEPGDGGGGVFYWQGPDAIDDGGTIIVPFSDAGENSAGPCWKRIYSGPLNVKWFGAKGDNQSSSLTENNGAFARAINAARLSGGGVVYIPGGIYHLSETLDIPVGVSLVGAASSDAWGCFSILSFTAIPGQSQNAGIRMHCVGTSSGGFELRDLLITRPAGGGVGGTAIHIYAERRDTEIVQPSNVLLHNILVTGVDGGKWDCGLFIDGSAQTMDGSVGVRSVHLTKVRVGNVAAGPSMKLHQCSHLVASLLQVDEGDGPAKIELRGHSANLIFNGLVCNGHFDANGSNPYDIVDSLTVIGHVGGNMSVGPGCNRVQILADCPSLLVSSGAQGVAQGVFGSVSAPPNSPVIDAGGGAKTVYFGGTSMSVTADNLSICPAGLRIGDSTAPTARIHIKAGSAAPGTAPLKFSPGALLDTPESGAIEFDNGGRLYLTNGPNARYRLFVGFAAASPDLTVGTLQPGGVFEFDIPAAGALPGMPIIPGWPRGFATGLTGIMFSDSGCVRVRVMNISTNPVYMGAAGYHAYIMDWS